MSTVERTASRGQAQSIVEFALVLPLFVLLLFGFIDFARLEFSYISLANAARELARVASIPGNLDDTLVDRFNNYSIIASDWNGDASVALVDRDKVTMTVTDRDGVLISSSTCTLTRSHGGPVVHGLMRTLSGDADACIVPSRTNLAGGTVDVKADYHFTFNPLFQNRLTGILDAWFLQQVTALSTTSRAYIE